ncbi:hypothetical protein [Mariniblastus fucicola]|uniref:Type 4 fimbrial biogenesis protein PilX N-terminal domain-containing protein n=1 Tax=Mariniblastus fucicola TaxID=980251 RepID=A0A5B9P2Y3_9BACT|nr:hypothetical protein [Mariniblastus fucicola]QEG20514.1 hypothetical protein MFFC18_03630 [Mariniblastus fucicola]
MKALLSKNNRRSGSVLVAVLVCLGVIGALIFASMQLTLRQRKQLDREMQMEQTFWLAEAGMDHALNLIENSDGDLDSEQILLSPTLSDRKTAEVKIEFSQKSDVVDVEVTAWIGLDDRPETQTRQNLKTEVKKPSRE